MSAERAEVIGAAQTYVRTYVRKWREGRSRRESQSRREGRSRRQRLSRFFAMSIQRNAAPLRIRLMEALRLKQVAASDDIDQRL